MQYRVCSSEGKRRRNEQREIYEKIRENMTKKTTHYDPINHIGDCLFSLKKKYQQFSPSMDKIMEKIVL